MDNLIAFGLSVLTLLAVPGPTNTLLAASGATIGVRRSLHLLLAELLAYNLAVLAIRAIVDAFGRSSTAEILFRVAVAAYLVYLAIRLWRAPANRNTRSIDARSVFVTTLLNPKGLIFGLVIFPAQPGDPALYFGAFSVLVPIVGAAWIFAGSVATNVAGERYVVWVPRVASVALAIFATVLLVGIAR
jgi:threonine/homoserine/homoserine lactone efflux protein